MALAGATVELVNGRGEESELRSKENTHESSSKWNELLSAINIKYGRVLQ
jgi:hypothetical protein